MRNSFLLGVTLLGAVCGAVFPSPGVAGLELSLVPEYSKVPAGVPYAGYAVVENSGDAEVVLEKGVSVADGGVEYLIINPGGEEILISRATIGTLFFGRVETLVLPPDGKIFWPVFLAAFDGGLIFEDPGVYTVVCRLFIGENFISCREKYTVEDCGGDWEEWERTFPYLSEMTAPFGFGNYSYSHIKDLAGKAGGDYARFSGMLFLYGTGKYHISSYLEAKRRGADCGPRLDMLFDEGVRSCQAIADETGVATEMWNYISRFKSNTETAIDVRNFWVFRR